VDVVYDSVGKTTFDKSLNVLRPRGMMVLFGGPSGAVPPFDPLILTQKGSLFLTRPSLGHYVIISDELQKRASAVFGLISAGKLLLIP
jgi:NADPH2:quinone reductase